MLDILTICSRADGFIHALLGDNTVGSYKKRLKHANKSPKDLSGVATRSRIQCGANRGCGSCTGRYLISGRILDAYERLERIKDSGFYKIDYFDGFESIAGMRNASLEIFNLISTPEEKFWSSSSNWKSYQRTRIGQVYSAWYCWADKQVGMHSVQAGAAGAQLRVMAFLSGRGTVQKHEAWW